MLTDTADWVGMTLSEGRYKILRKLGEGGMAHVYLANDEKLDRNVVIKVPRSNLISDATFAGRFTREVRSLAKLAHPHIVPLLEIGQQDNAPFSVMTYLTGGSLRDRQPRDADGKPAPHAIESLKTWLPAIAQALDFVHKSKFIHRDVKPENILFDEHGQVFLSDLGIVKALADNQQSSQNTAVTGAGMVLGTPHYMAPELILGDPIDGRADQYALAITVYEAVTGRLPFDGGTAPKIFIQQTTKAPPPLREIQPSAPAALAAAVEKALAKRPTLRFDSCVEFAQAALANTVPPVPPTERELPALLDSDGGTIIEADAGRIDTPANSASPTAVSQVPVAKWHSAPASRRPPANRRSMWLGLTVLGLALFAGCVYFFAPNREPEKLSVSPVGSVSLAVDTTQKLTVEIQRTNFDGDVTCWLDGLPTGVVAERLTIPKGKTSGTIELSAPIGIAAAKSSAKLKAKYRAIEAEAPFECTIVGSEKIEFFAVEKRPLKAGESAVIPIRIERKFVKGLVKLTVTNLPTGVRVDRPSSSELEIAADQSEFPLELKADSSASAGQSFALVTGSRDSLVGEMKLELTILPAPPPPVKVKEKEKEKEKRTDPDKEKEKLKDKDKTETPAGKPPYVPVGPPQLILANILDVVLKPGERRTVWVQLERINCAGPVDISIGGLPLQGLTIAPRPLPPLHEKLIAYSFEVVAPPNAEDSKSLLGVTAILGATRSTKTFSVTVRKNAPVVPVRKILLQKTDRLTSEDLPDSVRKANRSKSFPIYFKKGNTYVIDMVSSDFDSYLRLEGRKSKILAEDDNSGGNRNARITFTAPDDDTYYIVATTAAEGALGQFTITVK